MSLDEGDNDRARFRAHVAPSLRRADLEVPGVRRAGRRPGDDAGEAALPLINALAQSGLPHVLIRR